MVFLGENQIVRTGGESAGSIIVIHDGKM